MRYLMLFSQLRNSNVINKGSDRDLGWTPRIILITLFCKISRGSIFFYTQIPKLDYIISCKDIWISSTTYHRFTMDYFSSLDYNPYATSNLSTHKWYMIYPTQFVVNNHTQEFWYINFSKGFPSICRFTWTSWKTYEMCFLYIQW